MAADASTLEANDPAPVPNLRLGSAAGVRESVSVMYTRSLYVPGGAKHATRILVSRGREKRVREKHMTGDFGATGSGSLAIVDIRELDEEALASMTALAETIESNRQDLDHTVDLLKRVNDMLESQSTAIAGHGAVRAS